MTEGEKNGTPDQERQPPEQSGWSNGDIRPSDDHGPAKLPMQDYGLPEGLNRPRASIRGH